MNKSVLQNKNVKSKRRANHVRRGIRQHSDLPRLSVTRSLKHISVQVIDDRAGRTLAAVSTTGKSVASELSGKTKTERAKWVGAEIARKAKDAGIESVVFDRGPSKYHGRVKALADAAREAGLRF